MKMEHDDATLLREFTANGSEPAFAALVERHLKREAQRHCQSAIHHRDEGETSMAEGPDGKWAATYGFADGHTEIHLTADGKFEEWENQRRAQTASK